jgi:LysR family glycine cleavage system transcriptional activator
LLQPTRRPNTWHDWLEANNVSGMNAWAGPRFEHFYMIIQAAIAGLGVALLPRLLVNDDLISQRLITPFDGSFVSRDAYGLVYPASKRNDPRLEQFRKWLLDEAAMAQTSAIRHQKRKAARRAPIVRVVVR